MMLWRFLLIIASLGAVARADENLGLRFIRLNPDFVRAVQGSAHTAKAAGRADAHTNHAWQDRLVPIFFGGEATPSNQKRMGTRASGGDGQDSLIYDQIHTWLGEQYTTIGQQQASQVALFNQQFNLGAQNFSGFTWQRPFGGFSVHAFRQISPDLFDDKRWIVMDTFTINVEAASFLGKLAEGGVVSLMPSEIAGFAGINFKRTYTTYHFATDANSALYAEYTDLFLPFLAYRPGAALNLPAGKIMRREDAWTVGAGGLIESPSYYGLSFNAGALAELTHSATLTLQGVTTAEALRPGEFLRVSHASSQARDAGVAAGLQLDFFNILNLTLFSFDLEYHAKAEKTFHLSFIGEDRPALAEGDKGHEFAELLRKNSPEVRFLAPHVVKLDEHSTSGNSSRTMLLLWGTLKKSSMEKIRVIKDGLNRDFFRHHSESVRLVQNFWSRLFSSFIFRLFSFRSFVQNDAALTRRLDIEYEGTLPQSPDPAHMAAEHQEQFSFTVNFTYEAARTDRWQDRSYKEDMEQFMARYTTLSAQLRGMVRNGELKGPMRTAVNLRVMGDGLVHLNGLPDKDVETVLNNVCKKKKPCLKRLLDPFREYKKILAGTKRLELALLKKTLTGILKEAQDLGPFRHLFGEYAFINGQFNATSRSGMPFATSFANGQFRGLGVIDTFQRQNGTRTPASVSAE